MVIQEDLCVDLVVKSAGLNAVYAGQVHDFQHGTARKRGKAGPFFDRNSGKISDLLFESCKLVKEGGFS